VLDSIRVREAKSTFDVGALYSSHFCAVKRGIEADSILQRGKFASLTKSLLGSSEAVLVKESLLDFLKENAEQTAPCPCGSISSFNLDLRPEFIKKRFYA
jgi:hypothetical protein